MIPHALRALLRGEFALVLGAALAMSIADNAQRMVLPFYLEQIAVEEGGTVGAVASLFARAELLRVCTSSCRYSMFRLCLTLITNVKYKSPVT